MVEHILQVVTEYEGSLRGMQYVPRFSYGRRMLRDDGVPNRSIFDCLFIGKAMAIQFMKEVGLLRSKMQCNTCGQDMTWSADSILPEGFLWLCQKRVAGTRCNQSVSNKHESWLQKSNLTFQEILLITYVIGWREQAHQIQNEYSLSAHTVADRGTD